LHVTAADSQRKLIPPGSLLKVTSLVLRTYQHQHIQSSNSKTGGVYILVARCSSAKHPRVL